MAEPARKDMPTDPKPDTEPVIELKPGSREARAGGWTPDLTLAEAERQLAEAERQLAERGRERLAGQKTEFDLEVERNASTFKSTLSSWWSRATSFFGRGEHPEAENEIDQLEKEADALTAEYDRKTADILAEKPLPDNVIDLAAERAKRAPPAEPVRKGLDGLDDAFAAGEQDLEQEVKAAGGIDKWRLKQAEARAIAARTKFEKERATHAGLRRSSVLGARKSNVEKGAAFVRAVKTGLEMHDASQSMKRLQAELEQKKQQRIKDMGDRVNRRMEWEDLEESHQRILIDADAYVRTLDPELETNIYPSASGDRDFRFKLVIYKDRPREWYSFGIPDKAPDQVLVQLKAGLPALRRRILMEKRVDRAIAMEDRVDKALGQEGAWQEDREAWDKNRQFQATEKKEQTGVDAAMQAEDERHEAMAKRVDAALAQEDAEQTPEEPGALVRQETDGQPPATGADRPEVKWRPKDEAGDVIDTVEVGGRHVPVSDAIREAAAQAGRRMLPAGEETAEQETLETEPAAIAEKALAHFRSEMENQGAIAIFGSLSEDIDPEKIRAMEPERRAEKITRLADEIAFARELLGKQENLLAYYQRKPGTTPEITMILGGLHKKEAEVLAGAPEDIQSDYSRRMREIYQEAIALGRAEIEKVEKKYETITATTEAPMKPPDMQPAEMRRPRVSPKKEGQDVSIEAKISRAASALAERLKKTDRDALPKALAEWERIPEKEFWKELGKLKDAAGKRVFSRDDLNLYSRNVGQAAELKAAFLQALESA